MFYPHDSNISGLLQKGGSISVSKSIAKQLRRKHLVHANAGAELERSAWELGRWIFQLGVP